MVSPILTILESIYQKYKNDFNGKLASYIPELTKADPRHFGICIATIDGQIYEMGDSSQEFTIQSISKVFTYGLALADHGADIITEHVGVEPSGDVFNSIIFDEKNNRPHNPMVNAGAIAITALIKGEGAEGRFARIKKMLELYAGRSLSLDKQVYSSEKATGHRNRAIAYLELNSKMIDEPILEHLDLYFKQCSILINAQDLAVMAATLANHGINPLTSKQAEDSEHICHILSVMQSCGMYNFSGEWLFRVGLPAKSGVSGGIIAVVPGFMGIGIYSPLIDEQGNSVRGVHVCEELSKNFDLHLFALHPPLKSILRRCYSNKGIKSSKQRNPKENAILLKMGSSIEVCELQGDLFFSSIEQLCRKFNDLAGRQFVILDGMHVERLDRGMPAILASLREVLKENHISLLIAGQGSPLFEALKIDPSWPSHHFFSSIDHALEWCEDALINSLGNAKGDNGLSFEEMEITKGLDAEELQALRQICQLEFYEKGAFIIKEGDEPSKLYMLAKGGVGIYILEEALPKRIGAIGQGIIFGEQALFNLNKHLANFIAESPSECFVLPIQQLAGLSMTYPKIYTQLLLNAGRILTLRLQQASEEIDILAK